MYYVIYRDIYEAGKSGWQEIWTSFGYKTEREEDRSSPILGVPMRLRKHLSGLRNAFKKWTYKKLRLLPQKKADAWMAGSDGRTKRR